MQSNKTVDLKRFENAVGVCLTLKAWGNTRKADMGKVTTEADKARLKLTKSLIEAEEYEAIKSALGALRQWVYSVTVPSFFTKGLQLATVEAATLVNQRFDKFSGEELPALVAALQAVYPAKIEEARESLRDQFRLSDYPSAEDLPGLFGAECFLVNFKAAEALPPELRKLEEEKLARKFEDAGNQIIDALRVAFLELIEHATERLTTAPGEKGKTFRDSLIANIEEFLGTFSSRNLMGDSQLAELVDRARMVMVGIGGDSAEDKAQKLRKSEDTRAAIAGQFSEIKTALDGMVETRKGRKFDFAT